MKRKMAVDPCGQAEIDCNIPAVSLKQGMDLG